MNTKNENGKNEINVVKTLKERFRKNKVHKKSFLKEKPLESNLQPEMEVLT
jgi:hypothetical protein